MTAERDRKGSSVPDVYDLQPMAFAKEIGLVIPKNPTGALSYRGLLKLALDRYYDLNTHLAKPLDKAA